MRKRLALLLALCLTAVMAFGVIGSGAIFQWTGHASQAIAVGTFGCALSSTTGEVSTDKTSVSLTSLPIMSSVAANAPFDFTVTATGAIPVKVHVTQTALDAPFSSVLANPIADVNLVKDGTHTYNTGIQWTELGTADLGKTASITYTVTCSEYVAPPVLPANTYVPPSTNAANQASGHPYFTATPMQGAVQLTFYDAGGTVACFEYRTDGNAPEQRLGPNEVVGATPFLANYHGINPPNSGPGALNDGLYSYVCPGHAIYGMAGASYGNPATITVPVTQYVEVRLVFGAERDYDFDWTRFDAS